MFPEDQNPELNTPGDGFWSFGDIEDKFGRAVATRFALMFGPEIDASCWWEDEFAGKYRDVPDLLAQRPEAVRELHTMAYYLLDDHEFVGILRKHGYDGAVHGGSGESFRTAEYKVLDASQVRTAVGRRGLPGDAQKSGAVRFYRMAGKLPREIQSILINRIHGRAADSIHWEDSEKALRNLAASYL